MKEKHYRVIGVMSGTSLDGIDVAALQFVVKNNVWTYQFIEAETFSYSTEWITNLSKGIYQDEDLQSLNERYTTYLAKKILHFINKYTLQDIDMVCSHGHTIFHQPEHKYTLQIGNLPILAKLINQKVVCDFRVQDVELGGQGAPLVPIGDQLLFAEYDYCLNLGGFANSSTTINEQRIAFDICAVNTVLNRYASQLGLEYDEGGKIARNGKVNKNLLSQLNKLPFYKQPAPKSLGMEWVEKHVFPLLEQAKLSSENILSTYTAHLAYQIANSFEDSSEKKILVTGGGAYNDFLIECIQKKTRAKLIVPTKRVVEYKEALIFALLGVLKIREETNVLKSVTGAIKNHSSGRVYKP